MITKDKLLQAADYLRKRVEADDFNFRVFQSDEHLTRFAQNGITQHINGNKLWVSLETSFDTKKGSAQINGLDENSLDYLLKTAQEMAKINQPDPEFTPSQNSVDSPEIQPKSPGTENLTTERMVDEIAKCIDNAIQLNAKVSGISEKHLTNNFMVTGNGFEGFDHNYKYSHSMTMKKNAVETKVSKSVKDFSNFSMEQEISRLNDQFKSLKDPIHLDKGKIPVILRPDAVLNWLYYLIWTFDRRNADEGMSPFSEMIGKQCFGKDFTFKSTLDDKDLSYSRFDHEGSPSRNVEWIKNGVLQNMTTNRYYAKQKNLQAMSPYNIIIEGGESTEQEMMQKVGRGVIINRFWYIRPIDRKTGEWTGLTRDGVLYFEDGKIKNSVFNFRWNEILHEATKRILALGPSRQLVANAKAPTLLIDDFNFVDVTTF